MLCVYNLNVYSKCLLVSLQKFSITQSQDQQTRLKWMAWKRNWFEPSHHADWIGSKGRQKNCQDPNNWSVSQVVGVKHNVRAVLPPFLLFPWTLDRPSVTTAKYTEHKIPLSQNTGLQQHVGQIKPGLKWKGSALNDGLPLNGSITCVITAYPC